MLSVSRLLNGTITPGDPLRYGRLTSEVPAHLLHYSLDKKPIVAWNLTRRCNLYCAHCYADATDKPQPGEMTTAEGRRLIDDLADFEVPVLLFSGGEPLMREDLFELAAYAVGKGIRCVLSTNGTLITPEVAKRIKEAGLSYVGVSLDGVGATHDKIRGKKGAFEQALQGIRYCRDAGIPVGLRFTVHAMNVDELPGIFDLAEEERIPRLCVYHLAYAGRGDKMRRFDLEPRQTRAVVDYIFRRSQDLHARDIEKDVLTVDNHADNAYLYMRVQKEQPQRAEEVHQMLRWNGGNQSGIAVSSVDPLGHLHVDQFSWHYSLGDVRQRPFAEIWSDTSDPVMRVLKDRKPHLKGRCRVCKWLDVCNGNLRVRAERYFGDFLAPDPACYLTDEEIGIAPGTPAAEEATKWPVPVQDESLTMAKAKEATAEQLDTVDRRLLDMLQGDFPVTARPFAAIGEKLGLSEEQVLARVRRLKSPETGQVIRQISAIFDTAALGYKSTLVAMQVPQDEIERVAAAINRHPGVSHNYQRDHTWNLWLTLAVPPDAALETTVEALVDEAGGYPYRPLPALRVFKIGMQLDMEGAGDISPVDSAQGSRPAPSPTPNARDRAFIRELQEDIEIVPQPFAGVADRLGVSQDEVLAWLQQAKAVGWLRRFAAILRQRQAGYVANGMVAWRVPDDSIERVATVAASLPQVSHCYQRLTYPDWPYNLFTMIHAKSKENCQAIARKISQETGVSDYVILFSTKEYKKARPKYFASAQGVTTSRSQSLHTEAQKYMPGGVNSPVRAFGAVGGEPLFVARGEGPYIYDVDGRRYIDYVLSWGPLILGHAHPQVVSALKEATELGISYGAPTALETELAKRVVEAVPSIEMVRFVNSGTEANMSALRLARAYTGRSKIIKFEGCYHGHADFLLVRAGSGVTTLGLPDSAGVPAGTARDTLIAPYNDPQAVGRLFGENRGEIAAVIVEPVAGNMGMIPPEPGFLESLRGVTKAEGALLVFDEVITGFRVAYGGAQALYGVMPDLTCLGKVIGGGLPVGAYGGRREIMEMVAPLGPMYQAGTLSGNPLAMTAGIETLKVLAQPGVYQRLEEKSARLAAGLRAAAEAARTPVFQTRVGSVFCTFFSAERVVDYASAKRSDSNKYAFFFRAMLENGVYLAPSQFEAAFLSLAHSEQDIDRTIEAAEAAFSTLGG